MNCLGEILASLRLRNELMALPGQDNTNLGL